VEWAYLSCLEELLVLADPTSRGASMTLVVDERFDFRSVFWKGAFVRLRDLGKCSVDVSKRDAHL